MTYVDSPGFEITFASFMRSLALSKSYAPGRIDKLFYFFNDILTISHIPITVDTFIWNLLLCIFDFFMIYLSCPFGVFDNINVTIDDPSSKYLFSKTIIQNVSFVGISLALIVLSYYWIIYIIYVPQKQIITEFRATLLYSTVVYLPLLFIPFCGILLGSLLVSNIGIQFSQYALTAISFSLSLILIALLLTVSLFSVTTKYSLIMRNGLFAYWRPPFSLVDYFILFLSSMFFPFRMSYEPKSATVIAVIQFLYGIHCLLALRNFPFVSIVPLTIQIKISIDIIIFSIFTVINTWIPSTKIVLYSAFIVISYTATCISLFVLLILFKNSNSKITNLNYSKLPLSKASVSMIRFAINLSMTDIIRPEIIKAITLWRFSFDLVPDIVRYCIITRQQLKDYIIPHRSYSSFYIPPLQFLAFQLYIYEDYAAKDDNPRTESTIEELNILLKQGSAILDNFWTDSSFDQMNIYPFGCEIERITNKFVSAISCFPRSKTISQLWETYNDEIVHVDVPSMLKRNNPYELLYNPNTTVYGYLSQNEIEKPIPVEKKKSSVDWYLESLLTKSTAPLIIFYAIFFIAFLIISIVFDRHSYHLTESRLNHLVNMSDFLRLQTELANEKLAFIEPYAEIPSYHEIADLLGIDEETANIYSLTRVTNRSELADLISLYTFINDIPLPDDQGDCKKIPLFIILKYHLPEESSTNEIYCQMLYINFYSKYIAEISDNIIWNFSDENKIGKLSIGYFISIFIAISSILFIFFLFNDVQSQRRMIYTVKDITHIFKQNRNLKAKSYNVGINVSYSIIIWIILMSTCAIIYVICAIPTNKENEKVKRLLTQISIISKISRSAQDSLSFIEGHYLNQFDIPNIVDYLTYSREELVSLVDELSEIGIDPIFQGIQPLDKWSINETMSFSSILIDFSQLLSNRSSTEFGFFYARYLYLFNISILIQSTLPEMIKLAKLEIQKITSLFIVSLFAVIVVVIFCMVLNYFIYLRKITWYYAINTYLRRMILKSGSSFQIIQKILSKKKDNYLEELPYPFIIFEKQSKIILYSNSRITDYADYTMNQIIGQKLDSIFDIDNNNICKVNINDKCSIIQFHFGQIDQNHQTVSITDITDVYETNQTYQKMIKLIQPDIKSLPFRDSMIFIKIRYDQKSPQNNGSNNNDNNTFMQSHITKYSTQANVQLSSLPTSNVNANINLIRNSNSTTGLGSSDSCFDADFLLNHFDEAENAFNDVIRISCGATFYAALIPRKEFENDDALRFLNFLSLLTEKTEFDFIASVVYGMISCIPLDDDETRVVVCGETSDRANDCIISGTKNKIYMDDIIVSSFIGNEAVENSELLKNSFIVISPKTPPTI